MLPRRTRAIPLLAGGFLVSVLWPALALAASPQEPPLRVASLQSSAQPVAQRSFPVRLNIRYSVRAGDAGLDLGDALYTWRQQGDRYRLVSVAEASGLAALFVKGKLTQNSEGWVTASGLKPLSYWLERDGRRKDSLSFDWNRGRLLQDDNEVDLPPGSQDLLSFPFQLAFIADESAPEWRLWVSNGRKLRDYLFRNLGRERLNLGQGEVETLHLQGNHPGESRLDVWLAPAHHWLPVRIRTLDNKGKVILLSMEQRS